MFRRLCLPCVNICEVIYNTGKKVLDCKFFSSSIRPKIFQQNPDPMYNGASSRSANKFLDKEEECMKQ